MAFTLTYAGLQAEAADWLHRTDLTSKIPSFITLAEAYLTREIGFPNEETLGTITITAGAQYGALPTYFSRLRSRPILSVVPTVSLDLLTPDILFSRYASQAPGAPVACAIVGSNLYVNAPTDDAYTVSIDYFAGITPLSDTNTTNWLLTTFPDAYLFTTLLMAAPYVGSDNRIQTWEALSERSINGINIQGMLQGYGAPIVAQLSANVA